MKKQYLIALTAAVTILSACSKSKNEMNGEYVADLTTNASVRMFAASGEVKDQSVIQQYITNRQVSDYFTSAKEEKVDESEFLLSISGDQFTIKNSGLGNGDQTTRSVGGNRYVITWKGKVRVMLPEGGINISSKCFDLGTGILQYPIQQLDYQLTPGMTGFKGSYIPGIEYVVELKPGTVTLPLISYTATHNENTQSCMSSDGSFNLLREAGLTGLQTGDTIVFQQRTLHLKKK